MPRKGRAKPGGSSSKRGCGLDEQLVDSAINLDLVELLQLLEQGASVTFAREAKGTGWSGTALHAVFKTSGASLERRLRSQVVTALLGARADVNAQCTWGEGQRYSASAFDMAINDLVSGEGQRDMSMVREMLLQSADPNAMSRASILCTEASKLKARKSVSQTHNMETTSPLHRATRASDQECVRVLLSAGASVNAQRTEEGRSQDKAETALHIASELRDVSMVLLLLEHDADVNAVRKWLKPRVTGMEDAEFHGTIVLVESSIIEETALHIAVRCGPKNLLMVRTLVDAAADVNIPRVTDERRTSTISLCQQFQDVNLLSALESRRKVISINSHDVGSYSLKLNLSNLDGSSFEIEFPKEATLADLMLQLKTHGYGRCHVIGPSGSLWAGHLWQQDLCSLLTIGPCTVRERVAGAAVCLEGVASASKEYGLKACLETGISFEAEPIKTYVQRRVFRCLTAT